jgi:hypothetical protein
VESPVFHTPIGLQGFTYLPLLLTSLSGFLSGVLFENENGGTTFTEKSVLDSTLHKRARKITDDEINVMINTQIVLSIKTPRPVFSFMSSQ